MKVYLGTTGHPYSSVPRFVELFATQCVQRHLLVTDPGAADILLYTDCNLLADMGDWNLRAISDSPAARAYPHKVYVYDERDRPWCRFPGVYVSMPRYGQSDWTIPASYCSIEDPTDRLAGGGPLGRDLLYSFIGSPTAKCRQRVCALRHPRGHVERVDGFTFFDPTSVKFDERRLRFADILRRSSFALCPKGSGTSSFRLYEACASGCAPVIISDDWVAPAGPDWSSFSVRWPERSLGSLPKYLEQLEPQAAEMGARAREAYLEWFSPRVALTHQLDDIAKLHRRRDYLDFPRKGIRNRAWARSGAVSTLLATRRNIGNAVHRTNSNADRVG